MPPVDADAQTSDRPSPLVSAAQRLVGRIEALVEEVARLRADNAALRREVREAVALIDAAGAGRVDEGHRLAHLAAEGGVVGTEPGDLLDERLDAADEALGGTHQGRRAVGRLSIGVDWGHCPLPCGDRTPERAPSRLTESAVIVRVHGQRGQIDWAACL